VQAGGISSNKILSIFKVHGDYVKLNPKLGSLFDLKCALKLLFALCFIPLFVWKRLPMFLIQ